MASLINGHEFKQALGDSEGQGNLVCCSPWGCKESSITVTEQQEQQLSIEYDRKIDQWNRMTRWSIQK